MLTPGGDQALGIFKHLDIGRAAASGFLLSATWRRTPQVVIDNRQPIDTSPLWVDDGVGGD